MRCTDLDTNGAASSKRACLYDVENDPGEHHDVSLQHPDVVDMMLQRLTNAERSVYLPDRGEDTGEACAAAMLRGGYFGPFLTSALTSGFPNSLDALKAIV